MFHFKRFLMLFSFLSIMTCTVASRAASFPLDLRGTVPEQASVTVNVNKPAGAVKGIVTLTAFDADSPKEGQLVINGNDPVDLFGASGVSAHNQKWVDIIISTPASYWKDGNNTLLFKHRKTSGYVVSGAAVSFGSTTSSTSSAEPIVSFSANSLDFGTLDVGGISDPLSVRLSNTGSAALDISNLYATSANFSQTNNCNNYVPSGGNCTINVTFIPTAAQNYTENLTVISDATGSPHTVSLTGRGGDGSTQTKSTGSAGNYVLHVNFENRVANSAYTESQAIQDFNANRNDGAINGPRSGDTRVVPDPARTGRGKVLRSRHHAGTFKGGVNFKARFAPDNTKKKGSARFDDAYFAYDIYLPFNTIRMPYHKMPGMITGTLLEASHKGAWYNPISTPDPEGIISFTALMQAFTTLVVPSRGDGALSVNYYDAVKVQKSDWLDTVHPTEKHAQHSYDMPLGKWVTIEQRVKMNTADSNNAYSSSKDKKNGLAEVWINGVKMSSKTHLWRYTNTMKIDGFWFYDFYNRRPDLISPPSVDQYVYYDNFKVSQSPITH